MIYLIDMKEDRKLRFIFGKGWSLMNILIGFVFAIVGYIIGVANGILVVIATGDSDRIPSWFYVWGGVSFFFLVLGVLGFWLVIPAFQKWWHTKRWLAWTVLAIALLIMLFCFTFLRII